MNKREMMNQFSNKTPKAPELDRDVNALLTEKPDILPEIQAPEFPGSETLTCPNTFNKETLSKMMRRWYRHGFVTGFYRAYARKKLNEEQNREKEDGEVR